MAVVYAENCYGKYSVPEGLDHRPAVHLIKAGQVNEPKTLAFMRAHAGQGDIVHAGAFFGDLWNNAVSDKAGTILFQTHDASGNPLGGHSHFVTDPGPGVEEVECINIDAAVPEDRVVSILQLDVEGHAPQALRGAQRIIAQHRPIIILEGIKKMWWFRKTYKSLGYALRGTVHGNSIFSTGEVTVRDTIMTGD